MIPPFLKLRLKQTLRSIFTVGIFRLPIVIILLAFLLAVIFSLCNDKEYSLYLVIAILFIVLTIQTKRSDKVFLKTNFSNYQFLYLVDYFLICLIPLLCLLWHFQFGNAAILLLGCFFICFLDKNINHRKTRNTKIQKLIPDACFEWKSGIRRMFIPIIIFMTFGLGASFFIVVVPLAILLLTIFVLEFYNQNEPYQFVLSYEMGSKQFLFHKIKMQISLFSAMILPLIFVFLIFHYQYWYVIIAEYVILMSLIIYNILLKYAFYIPNGQVPAAYIMIVLFFGVILPIFVPVVWGLTIYFYFKAQQRLNFYLNDYN